MGVGFYLMNTKVVKTRSLLIIIQMAEMIRAMNLQVAKKHSDPD